MEDKGHSDFELNWFDFETRMRKLVYEARKMIANQEKWIEELEYALFKTDQVTTVFDTINDSFKQQEDSRKTLE